jgi:hypothetical protein
MVCALAGFGSTNREPFVNGVATQIAAREFEGARR